MSSFPRTLSERVKGKDVISLQKALLKAGYEIPLNELKQARFGKVTFEAVKKFQSDNRLNAPSVVNEAIAKVFVKIIVESDLRTMVTTTTTASTTTSPLRLVRLRTSAIATIVNLQGRNLSLRMRGDES